MSWSISRRTLRLYRSGVHPLLSILLPLLFLLSLDQLLRVLIPQASLFPRNVTPLLLAAGIEEAVVGNLLFNERASFAARVRELVLLLALCFGCLFVFLALQSGRGLRLSTALIYPMVVTLLQWLFSSAVHAGLREREVLLGALTGNTGAALRHSLRDSSFQAGLAMRVLRGIRAMVLVFQFLIVLVLVTAAVLERRPPLLCGLVVALHAIGGLLTLGLLRIFEEEQLLLGSGLRVPLHLGRRRLLFAALILAASAALVAVAARNASLLPLSALIALLQKLASLLRLPDRRGMSEGLQQLLIERQRYYDTMRLPQEPTVVNPLALLFVELLRRLFTTLLGTGLFLFLAFPLLSRDFLERLHEMRPFDALRKRIKTLLGFTLRLWLRLLHWMRSRGRAGMQTADEEGQARRLPKRIGTISRRPSVRKRIQMSRVERAFLALVRWGEQSGVPFVFFYTPGEYAVRLAALVPAGAGQLDYVVEVFEEVMFSPHLVAPGRIARYFQMIRSMRRLNPAGTGAAGTSSP